MSSTDATVLGKRERDDAEGHAAVDGSTANGAAQPSAVDDDDDDDIGPMPLPAGADTKATRKKRKGKP